MSDYLVADGSEDDDDDDDDDDDEPVPDFDVDSESDPDEDPEPDSLASFDPEVFLAPSLSDDASLPDAS